MKSRHGYLLFIFLCLAVTGVSRAAVVFQENFSSDPETNGLWNVYRCNGTPTFEAHWESAAGYELVAGGITNRGGALFADHALTSDDWTASFRYRIGGGTGADGFVFFFYKDEAGYSPPHGSYLGFTGAGYGIEFDGYENSIHSDPDDRHVALIDGSVSNHLAWAAESRVEDDTWHDCEVDYDHGLITVSLDGSPVLTHTLASPVTTYGGIGFCASTGMMTNDHRVDDFVLNDHEVVLTPTPVPTSTPAPVWQHDVGLQSPICLETSPSIPIDTASMYSATQYCIDSSLMPAVPGLIHEILWYDCQGGTGPDRAIEVWLGLSDTPCEDYCYGSSWKTGLQLVYSGPFPQDGAMGWKGVSFNLPFYYAPGSSLVVQVCDHTGTGSGDPADWAASPSYTLPCSVYGYGDFSDHCDDWWAWLDDPVPNLYCGYKMPTTRLLGELASWTPTPTAIPDPTATPVIACPPGSIINQPVHNPDQPLSGIPSDQAIGYVAYDNFNDLDRSICELRWYGVQLDVDLGYVSCDKSVDCIVALYEYDDGQPGAMIDQETVTPVKTFTGHYYFGEPLYEYHAVLSSCFAVEVEGFIGIMALMDPAQPGCTMFWITSGVGDGYSIFYDSYTYYPEYNDLSLCVVGGPTPTPTPSPTPAEVPALGGGGTALLLLVLGAMLLTGGAFRRR